jgi:hypothetical protein
MKIAYIAHPISGDVSGNLEKIYKIIRKINMEEPDIVPFAPYVSDLLSLDDNIPEERARGFANNKVFFEKGIVEELRLYGVIKSHGMLEEENWCKEFNIPVRSYILPELASYEECTVVSNSVFKDLIDKADKYDKTRY